MAPESQRNACEAPVPVSEIPTTCPRLFTLVALLFVPPRVPRSLMPVDPVHKNACISPEANWDSPTT